jgi:flavin reductase (DIM6/NTAB) family NADH-FMN oxidoreductase RutF
MKRKIDPFDYANDILHAVKKGVLVTTKTNQQINTMSISWGTMGIQWGLPIFTVFVRGCRHTSTMLEENPEFTINIPIGVVDKEIIRYCGTMSGRDVDKFKELGLHEEVPEIISVPGIKELPLTLECRVIYKQQQYPECMTDPEPPTHYPENSQDIHADYHTAYYGQIVSAYIIEE